MKVKPHDISTYNYDLSTHHAWISFLECFLHVTYRLTFKKWQIRKADKDVVETQKKCIQNQFKDKFELSIDQVKPGGSGTRNDGKTVRRIFQTFQESAAITGLNSKLLRRSAVILQTLSSGFDICSI
jgi:hypothetical protein